MEKFSAFPVDSLPGGETGLQKFLLTQKFEVSGEEISQEGILVGKLTTGTLFSKDSKESTPELHVYNHFGLERRVRSLQVRKFLDEKPNKRKKKKKIDYTIEQLTPDLYPNTTGFFETLSNLSYAPEHSTKEVQELLEYMEKQDTRTYVALKKNNDIIGTCKIFIERKFFSEKKTNKFKIVGHFEDVSTREGYEGKGIQRKLLGRGITYGQESKCSRIILDCSDKNVPFYIKIGFEIHEYGMRLDLGTF